MGKLATILKHGFGGVLRFSGRDSRSVFWPYAGCVLLLYLVAFIAITVPTFLTTFLRVQQFARRHPESSTTTYGPGSYSVQIHGSHPKLMPDMGALAVWMVIPWLIVAALVAAAVARRLRDSGRSPLWGLAPVPFIAFGSISMPMVFASTGNGAISPLFFPSFLNNLIYNVVVIGLIILLCMPTKPAPATAWAYPSR